MDFSQRPEHRTPVGIPSSILLFSDNQESNGYIEVPGNLSFLQFGSNRGPTRNLGGRAQRIELHRGNLTIDSVDLSNFREQRYLTLGGQDQYQITISVAVGIYRINTFIRSIIQERLEFYTWLEGVTEIEGQTYSNKDIFSLMTWKNRSSRGRQFISANNELQNTLQEGEKGFSYSCLLYTSPSPRDQRGSRMPSSA